MVFLKIIIIIFFCSLPLTTFAQPCSQKTEILVLCHKKRLFLCEGGQVQQQYHVALGRGGINKTKLGDRKTPLGEYLLESPHVSLLFNTFIPIKYPTPTQISLGYTGFDVGIHGPYHSFAWLGRLNCWVNWTAGCIAVGKNSEIKAIAQWVEMHKPVSVRILD